MPRDPNGNYTLPTPENPVVTGTVITADDFNTTMDDIAAELTDSWSRSGKGGLTSPVLLDDGTQAAPSLAFTNETGTGLYRSAAGVLRAAILGTWRLLLNATGIQVNGNVTATGTLSVTGASSLAGTVTAPVFSTSVTDSASAVGYTMGTPVAYSTSGAKLLSLKNNGVEKFAIDKDGAITVGSVGSGSQAPVVIANGIDKASYGNNAVAWTAVTDLTATLTTTGRPVVAMVGHASTASSIAEFYVVNGHTDTIGFAYRITMDGTTIGSYSVKVPANTTMGFPLPTTVAFATPAAGTDHVFALEAYVTNVNAFYYLNNVRLTVYEL